MFNIPPNSPIDLRALILYDIYQWKTPQKSCKNYEKLCEVLGKEPISYEDYWYWFNKYFEEVYYSAERDLPTPDIRIYILYNVINGKSSEKSIDILCEVFGANIIDKENHDFWYRRFENGHLFTPITFSNLPNEIITEIVKKCDSETHLNLRNVSYGLRDVVDQLKPVYTAIKVECSINIERIRNDEPDTLQWSYSVFPAKKCQKLTLRELEFVLRNRKLRLKSFYFEMNIRFHHERMLLLKSRHFFDLLNSLDNQIHVEKCSIRAERQEDFIGVLQCLKPGTLEKLEIKDLFSIHNINKIVRLDQWKQAKHLKLIGVNLPSIDRFLHFTTFDTGYEALSVENFVRLCNGLSQSINFKWYMMRTNKRLDTEAIKRVLNLQQIDHPNKFLIPNLNLVVEFSLDLESLKLSKYSV